MKLPEGFKNFSAAAFAPATIGNMAVGFDILGATLAEVGDVVKVSIRPVRAKSKNQITIASIAGCDSARLPQEAAENTAGKALMAFLLAEGLRADVVCEMQKGIPLGSGLGGSAASAVAAVVALNRLLKKPCSQETLLRYALEGEAVASGARHADNVAPALYGGVVAVFSLEPISIGRIPLPAGLSVAVVKAAVEIKTKDARALLAPSVPQELVVKQQARLAAFILGCTQGDSQLIAAHFKDDWIEPQRKAWIPYFAEVQASAGGPGVLGASISGAGPAIFALCENEVSARGAAERMQGVYDGHGVIAQTWVSEISQQGAIVLDAS